MEGRKMSLKQELKQTIEETTQELNLSCLGVRELGLIETVDKQRALYEAQKSYIKLLEAEDEAA